ncbi:unnamed protein product [Adineta ricciae]|nr:unnamed protein product [Adineta ricciae]
MDYSNRDEIDNSGPPENQENEEHDTHNISTASADTVFDEHSNSSNATAVSKRAIDYFDMSNIKETGRVKCSICFQKYKNNPFSDSNLRSNLGFKHGCNNYLYRSQMKQRVNRENKSAIASHLKKELDAAAVRCIVKDDLSFGTFRRPGMKELLEKLRPGYRGPTRQTVRKRLEGLRLTDLGSIFDEWIDNDKDYVTDDEGGEYVSTLGDEDRDDSDSDSDCSDDDNNSLSVQPQQGRRAIDDEEAEEINRLLWDPDELKKRISILLEKIRKLIKMINKSSILTSFVRSEVQSK